MKKLGIIVHAKHAYKFDFVNLVEDSDPADEREFIMIGTAETIAGLTAEEKAVFGDRIYPVKEVSEQTMNEVFEQIEAKYRNQGIEETYISTVNEYELSIVGSLEDKYQNSALHMVGPGSEVTDHFRNKLKMKEFMTIHGVDIPAYMPFDPMEYKKNPDNYLDAMIAKLGPVMFAKPIDGVASVNTCKINTKEELRHWCDNHLNDQKFEVDQFIDEDLYHCDCVVVDGEVKEILIGEYLYPNGDVCKGFPLASLTMDKSHPLYEKLAAAAKKALAAFPTLPNAVYHLEAFKSGKFLEVGMRPPGARGPEIHAIATGGHYENDDNHQIKGGVDLRLLHTRLRLGMNVDKLMAKLTDRNQWLDENGVKNHAFLWDVVINDVSGKVSEYLTPPFESDFHEIRHIPLGTVIAPKPGLPNTYVCRSFVVSNSDPDVLRRDFEKLRSFAQLAPNDRLEVVTPVVHALGGFLTPRLARREGEFDPVIPRGVKSADSSPRHPTEGTPAFVR